MVGRLSANIRYLFKQTNIGKSYHTLKEEIHKVIVGQQEAVNFTLLSILCGGHSLLIGVPGLAKTLLVNTVSEALGLNFKRIHTLTVISLRSLIMAGPSN